MEKVKVKFKFGQKQWKECAVFVALPLCSLRSLVSNVVSFCDVNQNMSICYRCCRFRYQSSGHGVVTWSLCIRCSPFPTKASLLHEAEKRNEREDTPWLPDW